MYERQRREKRKECIKPDRLGLHGETSGKRNSHRKKCKMEKKKTFSTMEIILVAFMLGSLLLSFLQSRRDEKER